MRATDKPLDPEVVRRQRNRLARTILGFVLAGLGVLVLLKQPEHGQTVSLLFVGVGCGMIEPSLVKNIFKQP